MLINHIGGGGDSFTVCTYTKTPQCILYISYSFVCKFTSIKLKKEIKVKEEREISIS